MADLIRLPVIREITGANALTVHVPDPADDCEGARTLRLVEHAVDSMQELRAQADLISARAIDLIRVTHGERLTMQAELRRAREERAAWEQQARTAQHALADAALRAREAELACREAEMAAQHAHARAEDAEARARSLEFYLKKISGFLQTRLLSADAQRRTL